MARDYCKHCVYCDLKNYNRLTDKYYCKKWGRYEKLDSGSCSSFSFDPSKRNLYLATKAVEKVDLPLDSDLYLSIREFRNELEKDEQYFGLLAVYDMVAPVLATLIEKDDDYGLNNCEIMIENYLEPAMNEFFNGSIDKAAEIYGQMVTDLMQVYNVSLVDAKNMEGYIFNKSDEIKCIPDVFSIDDDNKFNILNERQLLLNKN